VEGTSVEVEVAAEIGRIGISCPHCECYNGFRNWLMLGMRSLVMCKEIRLRADAQVGLFILCLLQHWSIY